MPHDIRTWRACGACCGPYQCARCVLCEPEPSALYLLQAEAARQAEQGTTKAALADCSVSSCCMGLVAFGKAELVLRQCNVEVSD